MLDVDEIIGMEVVAMVMGKLILKLQDTHLL
jgi:hypothetical protein